MRNQKPARHDRLRETAADPSLARQDNREDIQLRLAVAKARSLQVFRDLARADELAARAGDLRAAEWRELHGLLAEADRHNILAWTELLKLRELVAGRLKAREARA